jgi:hypothetical protein
MAVKPRMSERAFQSSVATLARLHQWRHAHFRAAWTPNGYRVAMAGDIGFPDLTLTRNGRLVFAELKADGGRLRPDQELWLEALRKTCAEVYLWTPNDWDTIEEVLA